MTQALRQPSDQVLYRAHHVPVRIGEKIAPVCEQPNIRGEVGRYVFASCDPLIAAAFLIKNVGPKHVSTQGSFNNKPYVSTHYVGGLRADPEKGLAPMLAGRSFYMLVLPSDGFEPVYSKGARQDHPPFEWVHRGEVRVAACHAVGLDFIVASGVQLFAYPTWMAQTEVERFDNGLKSQPQCLPDMIRDGLLIWENALAKYDVFPYARPPGMLKALTPPTRGPKRPSSQPKAQQPTAFDLRG